MKILLASLSFLFFLFPYILYFLEYPELQPFFDPRNKLNFIGTHTPWGEGSLEYNFIVFPEIILFILFILELSLSLVLYFSKRYKKAKNYLFLSVINLILLSIILLSIGWLADGTY